MATTVCFALEKEELCVLLGRDLREAERRLKNPGGMRKVGEDDPVVTAMRELGKEAGLNLTAECFFPCGVLEHEQWKRDPHSGEVVRVNRRPVVVGTYEQAIFAVFPPEGFIPPAVSEDGEMGDWRYVAVNNVWYNREIPFTQQKSVIVAVQALVADFNKKGNQGPLAAAVRQAERLIPANLVHKLFLRG